MWWVFTARYGLSLYIKQTRSVLKGLRKVWSYKATCPYVLLVWCLIKQRDIFAFNLNPFLPLSLYLYLSIYLSLYPRLCPTISFRTRYKHRMQSATRSAMCWMKIFPFVLWVRSEFLPKAFGTEQLRCARPQWRIIRYKVQHRTAGAVQ
jgi:hypothetical protein